jgi:hypothetical protein
MPLSETLAVLIINNSFILAGALIKYIGSSECMKFMCCRGGIEIRDLHHAHICHHRERNKSEQWELLPQEKLKCKLHKKLNNTQYVYAEKTTNKSRFYDALIKNSRAD